MKASILVPFRSGDPWRDECWAFVERWWREHYPDAELLTGDDPGEPFSRAASINRAAEQATGDRLIITDADTVWDCREALASGEHYVPKAKRLMLTESETRALLAGDIQVDHTAGALHRYNHDLVGPHVVSHKAFEQVEGFDPRFRGWGNEDNAFYAAITQLVGRVTTRSGIARHLWHPHKLVGNQPVWPGQSTARPGHALAQFYQRNARAAIASRDAPTYSIAIMGQPSRAELIAQLQAELGSVAITPGGPVWETRKAALRLANPDARFHVVLQDDVKLGRDFYTRLEKMLGGGTYLFSMHYRVDPKNPHRTVMHQSAERARRLGKNGFRSDRLQFGQGIALPVGHIEPAIAYAEANFPLSKLNTEEDICLGEYAKSVGLPVWYELPSLVDHRPVPSLLWGRTAPREAWWFA